MAGRRNEIAERGMATPHRDREDLMTIVVEGGLVNHAWPPASRSMTSRARPAPLLRVSAKEDPRAAVVEAASESGGPDPSPPAETLDPGGAAREWVVGVSNVLSFATRF